MLRVYGTAVEPTRHRSGPARDRRHNDAAWLCGNCCWSGVRPETLRECPVCGRRNDLTILPTAVPDED